MWGGRAARRTHRLVTGTVAAGLVALGIFTGVKGGGTDPAKCETRCYHINPQLTIH